MLNQRIREKLVLLVHNGENTYRGIKQSIPELTDMDLRIASLPLMINDLSKCVLSLDYHPSGDLERYQFDEEDTFSLSWYGEDLLHDLQKELRQEELTAEALKEAKIARLIAEKALAVEKAALTESRIAICISVISAIATIIGALV